MNSPPSNELKYSQIFFRVIKQHLQEYRCNHSIFQIATEADYEANKTTTSEALKGSKRLTTTKSQPRVLCYSTGYKHNQNQKVSLSAQAKTEATDDTPRLNLRLGGDDNAQ